MLQAMSTGHDGSLTTLHAGSAQEAVLRLVLMARFGMDLPTSLIEEQIATALDLIVVARRASDGARYVTTMAEVGRGPSGEVVLDECVSFDPVGRSCRLEREPAFLARAQEDGIVGAEEVAAWRRCLP